MSNESAGLADILRKAIDEYPVDKIGKGITSNPAREAIERELPERIRSFLASNEMVVRSSAGQGRWTSIPWVAVMDPRQTDRIQEGIYVVYLFEPQENRVSLTLNQGVTEIKNELGTSGAREQLREIAREVESHLRLDDFSSGPLEFPHASSRNELYGPGTIVYKRYNSDDMPSNEQVNRDLKRLVEEYLALADGGEPAVYQCPIKPDGAMERNYQRTVLEGVDRDLVEDICDVPIEHQNLRVWGNRADTPAKPGDYLLFAEREGRYDGEYTLLARIADARILNDDTASEFTDAVGWGDGLDNTFQHVMFLDPIHEADVSRGSLWELLGFSGWPNDTYSQINFGRQDSSFYGEYDSVTSFINEIEGRQIYPEPSTSEYWKEVADKRRGIEVFLSNPNKENFEEFLDPISYRFGRFFNSNYDELFDASYAKEGETTPEEVAEIIQSAEEIGEIDRLLELPEFGITVASEVAALLAPEKFAILDSDATSSLEALQFESPDPNTRSPTEYRGFLESVDEIVEQFPLREFVDDVPSWATDYQVANYAFYLHDNGEIDLSELVPADPLSELANLLKAEESQAELFRRAVAHLVAGKNVVFYGPPGTGKTRAADLLTNALCASDSLVTANAEWSNYQVVGGYRPAGGSWEPDPGFLTAAAERCTETLRREPARPSWLIIDELNRANLDEAFGDVFTLLDLDYRTTEPLSYADEEVYVPLSFRILATMNTYDQAQLFSLGYAFRRRFAFVRVPSLLESPEQSLEIESPIPSASPELSTSAVDLVDLIKQAAIESMCRGAEGEGVTERDVAAIFLEYSNEKTLKTALEIIENESDLQTDGLTPTETLVYFCMEVTDRGIVDIGQALLIDAMKYLIAHQLLFPEETSRSTLDDAIVSYVVPQFEHFISELRRAETIDQDSDAGQRFDQIIQLAHDLSLPRTAAVLKEARETKRLLS